MDTNRDRGTLSERERRILRDIEREIEGTDPELFGTFLSPVEPTRRLLLGALLAATGAILALATFTASVAVAIVGLATMGAGIGVGAVPAAQVLRNRASKDVRESDPIVRHP